MFYFYAALALAGMAGGLLAGLLGIGGGIFFLLILPDALQAMGVAEADLAATVVANSLLGTLVSALAASGQHMRQKTSGVQALLVTGAAAALTAFLSLYFIVGQPFFSVGVFNGIVVAVLSILLVRTLATYWAETNAVNLQQPIAQTPRDLPSLLPRWISIGALAGVLSSVTGLGGGILMVPLLRSWLRYPMRQAAFISSGAIVLSSLSAFYFSITAVPLHPVAGAWGYLVPAVAVPLVAGVVVSAPFGVRLATRVPAKTLTLLYLVFLVLVLMRRGAAFFISF